MLLKKHRKKIDIGFVMDKDKLKTASKKWSKRAAFFAVFGVTGTVALIAYNLYRVSKGLDEIDWDNLKL